MKGCLHKRRAPQACDKKHPTVNTVVLALCSFVCPSMWVLPGEFRLLGFLDDENPVGLCAWGSQGALIRYEAPFMWNGNKVPSSIHSFQKSLLVCSIWILHFMPGAGESSRDKKEWQLKVEHKPERLATDHQGGQGVRAHSIKEEPKRTVFFEEKINRDKAKEES